MAAKTKPSELLQPTISRFFAKPRPKRSSPPIDLTSDAEEQSPPRPTKKAKTTGETVQTNAPTRPPSTPVRVTQLQKKDLTLPRSPLASPVSRYAFRGTPGPSRNARSPTPEDEGMLSTIEIEANQARRDAFRRKLGGHFARRTNDALQIPENDPSYHLSQDEASSEGAEEAEEPEDNDVEVVSESQSRLSGKLKNFAASSVSNGSKGTTVNAKGKGRSKKVAEIGPSGKTYTPLEKQVVAMKKQHPDCLLLFEVGYKYRFFGPDAQIASKELGIACWVDRNFPTASIPVHRKMVLTVFPRLIAQGHKVGVIGQTETAALKKVGDNKSGPFERKLTELYTAATFVDSLDSADDANEISKAAAPSLACFVESNLGGMGVDQRVLVGMVAVIPSTGEVTYDEFEDGHMRTELETRITHIRPSELLLPGDKRLSKSTEKMLEYFTGNKRFNAGATIRVERFSDEMDYTEAFSSISEFYARKEGGNDKDGVMATIVDFPKKVVIALAHAIQYLSQFGIAEAFQEATFFTTFASRTHMLLAGTTLTNLEIYRNSTDFTERGSLLWVLDHTKTRFGSRMLKTWIGRPLTDESALRDRIEAVEEAIEDPPPALDKIKSLLKGLPDLVKGLAKISYGKCTPKELATLLTAYQRIANVFEPSDVSGARLTSSQVPEYGFKSPVWNDIAASLPRLRKPVSDLTGIINLSKARHEEDKAELWVDEEKYPEIGDCKFAILAVESELADELKSIRKLLKRPTLNYTSVSGNEYMIEVKHAEAKKLPANWLRVSSTKAVIRFHTPEVKKKLAEREQQKERLVQESEKAWQAFLSECNQYYAVFRDVTNKLATADCILSLATVATQPGYTKPQFVTEDKLEIIDGRHPMVEILRSDPFVPNTIALGEGDTRTKIITGPNMNGKSTCCRMIALITIMAQIGSYVPAKKAILSLHDCVLTRMGASDDLVRGQSTFMVELQETSDIMRQATSRSLLVLDELGRGTSTHDGQAIAAAVLHYLQTVKKPKILFITHYPLLAAEFAEEFDDVANLHMTHGRSKRADGSTSVNFLYRLGPGMATGSYGIECGRLAGLPDSVLSSAQKHSDAMKERIEQAAGTRKWRSLLGTSLDTGHSMSEREAAIKKLRATLL